jgi:4-hydroxybenzoyl-CoA thioesterase
MATGARFVMPSRYGETVTIESHVERFGRSSFDVAHRMLRGSELAIEAIETRVWAAVDPDDPERIRGVQIDPEVVDALTRSASTN